MSMSQRGEQTKTVCQGEKHCNYLHLLEVSTSEVPEVKKGVGDEVC